MEGYYKKYLKYKLKYLKVINQVGGGKFRVLTFNILHPFEKVTNVTFKTLLKNLNNSDETRDKFITLTKGGNDKFINNIGDILAQVDLKRFKQREDIIIEFIESYIKTGTIVCLQEVNKGTLARIKSQFKNVISNKEKDILITKTTKKNLDYSRDEYRVSIIPENYKIIKTNDLLLEFENNRTISKKNGVYVKIQDEAENIYHIINVHFHYLYSKDTINSKIDKIKKLVSLKEDEKLVIIGDTNKSLKDLDEFCDGLDLQSNDQDETINTFIIQPDISTTPDHILSNFKGKIRIIETIEDKQIIYDENMIVDVFDILLESSNSKLPIDLSLEDQLYKKFTTYNKYFSDHKPLLFIGIN
jgi:endonuclease/exonuclease/phosphatase family metal-dependent hydrolase